MTNDQKTILRMALPTRLRRLFDYLPPQAFDITALKPGIRIKVPFQSRQLVGVLAAVEAHTEVPYGKLKRATEILDAAPIFPPDIDQLCRWAAAYYHAPLGEVFASALPALLRKGKPLGFKVKIQKEPEKGTPDCLLELNEAQQCAFDRITKASQTFKTFLLDGVTGSGKTEVYLQVIADMLTKTKQVLVLVPEISLTPQTIARFRSRFSVPIAALHSNLSDGERLHAWRSALYGEVSIVIGTRSAIFTPFKQLGLIVVDEEHDHSFKQQDRFRYHARDLAIMRARQNQIPIILGSATPSLETLFNVKQNRYESLILPKRAGEARLPDYKIIDIRQNREEGGLSKTLLKDIRKHLDNDAQVMLFLNRRGFAPVLYCQACAFIAKCKRCDAKLVYHRSPKRLQCHYCDAQSAIPEACKQCSKHPLKVLGMGTERLEDALEKYFPQVPIIRVDRDSTRRKGEIETLLDQINQQKKAILLGTQMLAKGHHFPRVTLVGIIDADVGLYSADFRAAEQMGQLFLQVSGRAGRADKGGQVAIQTRHPAHPLLKSLITEGYTPFSHALLKERKASELPPFTFFAVFKAESYQEKSASDFLLMIKNMSDSFLHEINAFGPLPALMAKRKGLYCQHLILKAQKRSILQQHLKTLLNSLDSLPTVKSVKWVLDVDPVEM